ncbi:MAG: cysteine--tRNA ligase [Bacteroidota bacterium]
MDTLHLYNSLSRKKEKFEPLKPPFVGLYVCGPTVYGNPHLGHARSALSFDIVFRYLKHLGYRVRYVRNITDVGHLVNDADDGESKVEKRARLEQLEPMEIAQKYLDAYTEDMAKLNMLRPSIEPRATGHIPEQIAAVQKIIENGYAYVSNGSVYFDVAKYDKDFKYGKLSGRDLENMREVSRDNLTGSEEKRHPADFAVWKNADPTHIMRWDSPWGSGFPGWHIECTVMSTKYLGEKYDIHGGGMDLLFPHHEAEIAQSNACNCHAPEEQLNEARYWMHNNMITLNGQKMGKSLGNAIDLRQFFSGDHQLLDRGYTPMNIRFFILQAHYRSTLDFSNDALQASEKGYLRICEALSILDSISPLDRAMDPQPETEQHLGTFLRDCEAFMNDDFNTARVIARIFEVLPIIFKMEDKGKAIPVAEETFEQFRRDFHTVFYDILGLLPVSTVSDSTEDGLVEGLMGLVTELRAGARKEKNFEVADLIRDKLGELNIHLKDTPNGTEWKLDK